LSDAVDTGRALLDEDTSIEVEYFAAANPTDLSHATETGDDVVILVAARVDGVRLIDNTIVSPRNT
jgi:pantothenate synthetase